MKHQSTFNIPKKLWLTIILTAGLLFFAPSVYKMNNQQSKVDQEIASLKTEIAKAENKNPELKKMIAYLESESFLEEQARLNFNLKKPGEKAVVVQSVDGEMSLFQQGTSTEAAVQRASRSNYQKWLDYFFRPKV
ncbi:MAG: septum formation initiator family protein [Candidatus Falkowbacteria bacterium]